MDSFFKTLRKIQKKEREQGTLSRVENTFYKDIHDYLHELKNLVGNDPFHEYYGLIKEVQRIATEICQRRELKITNAAVLNIQRSYHLFTGKPKFDLVDTTPLNLTPEEESFYFSVIDTLTKHRKNISLDKFTDDEEEAIFTKPLKTEEEPLNKENTIETPLTKEDVKEFPDKDSTNVDTPKKSPKKVVIDKNKPVKKSSKENSNKIDFINPSDDEFVDLDAIKFKKDTELVPLIVFDDYDSIIAIDEKCYGPFYSQDIVVMPKINANIFVRNRKGRIIKT